MVKNELHVLVWITFDKIGTILLYGAKFWVIISSLVPNKFVSFFITSFEPFKSVNNEIIHSLTTEFKKGFKQLFTLVTVGLWKP